MGAPTTTQANMAVGGQEVWDEARLEEAMVRLKLLHIKVRPGEDELID